MEQKVMSQSQIDKNLRLSVLAIAAIQAIVTGLGISASLQAQSILQELQADPLTAAATVGASSPFMMISFYSILLLAASLWTLKEMRNKSLKSWLIMAGVFLFSLSTWAFPAGLIGLYLMIHDPSRDQYITELTSKV